MEYTSPVNEEPNNQNDAALLEDDTSTHDGNEKPPKDRAKVEKRRIKTRKLLLDAIAESYVREGKKYARFELEGQSIDIVKARENDLKQIAAFEKKYFDVGEPYTEQDFREKVYPIGEIFMLQNSKGKMIGITSITYGPESNRKIDLRDDDAYFMGSALIHSMRGKGISKHINNVREESAKEKGMKRIFTIVRPDNKRSLGALQKAGFHIVEKRTNMSEPYGDDDGTRFIMMKKLPLSKKK